MSPVVDNLKQSHISYLGLKWKHILIIFLFILTNLKLSLLVPPQKNLQSKQLRSVVPISSGKLIYSEITYSEAMTSLT